MEQKAHYRRNPEYIYREVAGESVLIPTGKAAERFFGIASVNSTGAVLWQALEQGQTLEELAALLAREYELEEEQSRADVADFLEEALSQGLVLLC